jgi:hypothetical protein
MAKKRKSIGLVPADIDDPSYAAVLAGVSQLLETARHAAARSVNVIMTTAYWEVGRQIVEQEQQGRERAVYGERLIERLSEDLTQRFGRGFSKVNLKQMRKFYMEWNAPRIGQTPSDQLANRIRSPAGPTGWPFPLSWSHYVRLLSVSKTEARAFYEAEALRGGWTVRQLDRQVSTQFYERTLLSRNKAAMLTYPPVGQRAFPSLTCPDRIAEVPGQNCTFHQRWAI